MTTSEADITVCFANISHYDRAHRRRVAYAPRMRFIVYGAGAVGGVTAALLVRAGHEVIAIARGAHGQAIAERGLTVETPDDTLTVPLRVVDHPQKIDWLAGHV